MNLNIQYERLNVNKLKIYFLGSGEIAVPVLRACSQAETIELVGVGTQPDRVAGRRGKLVATPVGRAAAESGDQLVQGRHGYSSSGPGAGPLALRTGTAAHQ